MSEREREREEAEEIERDSLDIGTGMGGGLAPVLPTDMDGENPDADWLASSKENAQLPNWIAAEPVPEGLPRMDEGKQTADVPSGTHIVTVFGDDIGRIDELYGYAPANEPAWAAIKDGGRKLMIPLMSGQLEEDGLRVPYPKELIHSAPPLPEHALSVADEMILYSHYNERRILPAAGGDQQEPERTLHLLNRAA